MNKKILEIIDKSEYSKDVKDLVKGLLYIELRNFERGDLRYGYDYDRVINRLMRMHRRKGDSP